MADTKLSDLTELAATLATGDLLYVADVSAGTAGSRKIESRWLWRTDGSAAYVSGGGTVALGGFLFTIPATGTASLIDATETLTNKTLTSPTINTPTIGTPSITGGTATSMTLSGTITAPTISTPTITGGTIDTASMGTPSITGGTASSMTLTNPTITNGTMGTATITGGTIDGATITGGTIEDYTTSFAGTITVENPLYVTHSSDLHGFVSFPFSCGTSTADTRTVIPGNANGSISSSSLHSLVMYAVGSETSEFGTANVILDKAGTADHQISGLAAGIKLRVVSTSGGALTIRNLSGDVPSNTTLRGVINVMWC